MKLFNTNIKILKNTIIGYENNLTKIIFKINVLPFPASINIKYKQHFYNNIW